MKRKKKTIVVLHRNKLETKSKPDSRLSCTSISKPSSLPMFCSKFRQRKRAPAVSPQQTQTSTTAISARSSVNISFFTILFPRAAPVSRSKPSSWCSLYTGAPRVHTPPHPRNWQHTEKHVRSPLLVIHTHESHQGRRHFCYVTSFPIQNSAIIYF